MNGAAEIAEAGKPTPHGGLQWRIFAGFVLGLLAGLAAYFWGSEKVEPFIT